MEIMPHIVITDWLMPTMDGLELTKPCVRQIGEKMSTSSC